MDYPNRKYLYVVEGNSDEDRLKKLGVTYIIKTGGKFIRPEIPAFLAEVRKVRDIVLLFDPDGPGRQITKLIQNKVENCIVVTAEKKKAIFHHKVGIAEMRLEDIKELISSYLEHDNKITTDNTLTQEDFIDLGFVGAGGKKQRMALIEKYHMPFTSGKNVLDALNMLCLSKEETEEVLSQ